MKTNQTKDLTFKFDFDNMQLKHGVELSDGFFELYNVIMQEKDIEQLQFILWSVQNELKSAKSAQEYSKGALHQFN